MSLYGQQVCGSNPWPFSARFTPLGDRLYVPLFGSVIGSGGCVLLRLDPTTYAPLAVIPTGESPEEVAFVTQSNGFLRLGFVTNSSASSVTVFNPQDQVVGTVPIPPMAGGAWPTAFPFGIITSPDQRHVYVGTGDGQGIVYAIDTSTLTLDPSHHVDLGPGHAAARMVFVGDDLIVPTTVLHASGSGSDAYLVAVEPGVPGSRREVLLGSASTGFLYPSPQDCAVDAAGMVWVAGYDLGPVVFAIDPRVMHVLSVVQTNTGQPDGKFQALGTSPDGLLVVGDFFTGELACIDTCRRQLLTVIDPTQLPIQLRFPQEIEFSPTSRTLVVPGALGGDFTGFSY